MTPYDPGLSLLSRTCIHGTWKLIDSWQPGSRPEAAAERKAQDQVGRWELFDLAADPLEERNLAAEQPARVQALAARIDGWWQPTVPPGAASAGQPARQ